MNKNIDWENYKLGDVIQFGKNYRIYFSILSDSHGESIKGPMSRQSIGKLVTSLLAVNENIEINIKKIFSREEDE